MMTHPATPAPILGVGAGVGGSIIAAGGKLSMNGIDENRHYLRAFIQTYRDLPVLWDTSLRDYTNREKRSIAYEQLVPIYRYLKRDATVEDVKKKINTLRTNYRKELKVVECARRSGSSHTPRCWTFHELDFLRNTEKFLAVNPNYRSESFSAFSENSQASFIEPPTPYSTFRSILSSPPSVAEMFQKSFGHPQKMEPQQTPPSSQLDIQSHHSHSGPSHDVKRQRISPTPSTTNAPNSDELLSMACDYLSGTFPEEESIIRTWTHKLKRMQREQRLLAEKFINEILFEGETGSLHRNSVHINSFESYVRFDDHNTTGETQETQKSQSPSVHTSTAVITAETDNANKTTNSTGNNNENHGTSGAVASGTSTGNTTESDFSRYN